jgi:branched-chain amino acid transport system substrate-binding protein
MRLPAAALLVASKLAADDPQKSVEMGYAKAYSERYKEEVSTFGGHAYDALMIAVEAIKRAGSTDKAKVRDQIEATKNYVGTSGKVTMSPTDHMGLDLTAFRMLEVRNNDWALIN